MTKPVFINTGFRSALYILLFSVCALCFFYLYAVSAEPPCDSDLMLENERYLRGDVNNDGVVNELDILAISGQINTNTPDKFYMRADVNADDKVNSDDVNYLRNYLSGKGPAPCVASVLYCTGSPCIVRIDNQIIELTAAAAQKGAGHANWVAKAYSTNADNKKELAIFNLDLDYGIKSTTLSLSYERKNSLFGLTDIPNTTITAAMPTPYYNENIQGEADTLTVLMGVSALITAKGNAGNIPQSPWGCNTIVNTPKYPISGLQDNCCVDHNFCYRRGGSQQDKTVCDERFFKCLDATTDPHKKSWCGKWVYRKAYVNELISLFNTGSFNYHNEEWACYYQSQGKETDAMLDNSKVIQDCGSCNGKNECTVKCIVDAGETKIEYPCVKRK